ncbi:hypothetical protein BC828DRAFT_386293 [Blastocladiella britannica]|nr:hypothetical protein BC828DRAFT_386293 [Blastocladiella britannica]
MTTLADTAASTSVRRAIPRALVNAIPLPMPPPAGIPYAGVGLNKNGQVIIAGGMSDPLNFAGASSDAFILAAPRAQAAANGLAGTTVLSGFPNGVSFGNPCVVVAAPAADSAGHPMGGVGAVAGGQFSDDTDQRASPVYIRTPASAMAGGNWTRVGNTLTIPRWHYSGCAPLPGSTAKALFVGGVADTDPSSFKTGVAATPFFSLTSSNDASTVAADVAPFLPPIPPRAAGAFVTVNSTHIAIAGGVSWKRDADTQGVADAGTVDQTILIDTSQGNDGQIISIPMRVPRVLSAAFVIQQRFLVHLGGAVPAPGTPKTDALPIIEYVDLQAPLPTSAKDLPPAEIANPREGPSRIYAPTAWWWDGHIFIVGGLADDAPVFPDKVPLAPTYLRILQVNTTNSSQLTFRWVPSYTPSTPLVQDPQPEKSNAATSTLSISVYITLGVLFLFLIGWYVTTKILRKRRGEDAVLVAEMERKNKADLIQRAARREVGDAPVLPDMEILSPFPDIGAADIELGHRQSEPGMNSLFGTGAIGSRIRSSSLNMQFTGSWRRVQRAGSSLSLVGMGSAVGSAVGSIVGSVRGRWGEDDSIAGGGSGSIAGNATAAANDVDGHNFRHHRMESLPTASDLTTSSTSPTPGFIPAKVTSPRP